MSFDIDTVSAVVAALYFDLFVHLTISAYKNTLRIVPSLLVALAQLTINVETPSVEVTILSKSCGMAKTS